jgi:hypothetical protein
MSTEIKIKVPSFSFKDIKDSVGNAMSKTGDAIVNAKTPSLKELGTGAVEAGKTILHGAASAAHKAADAIDPKPSDKPE